MCLFSFFFSSRRRHTRFDCDWSSDVCSSDLKLGWQELVGDWPWILQPATSPARIALDQLLQRLELPVPADIIECSSVYSMQQLVQLTDAVMLLSESALKDYLRMGLVRALPVCIDVPMAPFGILTRTDDAPTQEQQRFIALLRAQARGLAQAG